MKIRLLCAFSLLASLDLSAQTFDVTSTGVNSTPIGATTPSTGAFTTLSATGKVTSTFTGEILGNSQTGASSVYLQFQNNTSSAVGRFLAGIDAGGLIPGAASGDVWSGGNGSSSQKYHLLIGGAIQASLSSAGLEVTGVVSSTGTATIGAATTAPGQAMVTYDSSLKQGLNIHTNNSSTSGNYVYFENSGGTGVGSISRNGDTSVAYNTTSDVRLKTNIRDFTDSGRFIDALRPRMFDWKAGDKDIIGFIAQEENAVDPALARIGAVTVGDEDPDTIATLWQRSDQALVPILTAEIKSLRARLAAVESGEAGAARSGEATARELDELKREVAALKAASAR